MMGKQDGGRAVVDGRLEEVAGLFAATGGLASPGCRDCAPPAAAGNDGEGKGRRSRRWERENPAFSFRIRAEDSVRIGELAREQGATRDEVAEGLVAAAVAAVKAGWLRVTVERAAVMEEAAVRTPQGKMTKRQVARVETTVGFEWGGAVGGWAAAADAAADAAGRCG